MAMAMAMPRPRPRPMLLSTWFLLLAILTLPHLALSDQPPNVLLPGMKMPSNFQSMEEQQEQEQEQEGKGDLIDLLSNANSVMRVTMKHREAHPLHHHQEKHVLKESSTKSKVEIRLREAMWRDAKRTQEIKMKVEQGAPSPSPSPPLAMAPSPVPTSLEQSNSSFSPPIPLQSSVESGAYLGSGEYFMDVYMGTPPKHFSLIIDTGSDLIWTQCHPCNDCYNQSGPIFTPNGSSTYRPLSCKHPQCEHIYHPDPSAPCESPPRPCHYSYSYGDYSHTIGDLATETFTLGVGNTGTRYHIPGIVFGCGHSNRGSFRGAGGLLGLGKGPLSFPSQLNKKFGRKFSYCLVGRDTNASVNSVLTFGEDRGLVRHPQVQYTKFLTHTYVNTFYYLDIAKVSVGGEDIPIPSSAWTIDAQGRGGTIIDSGTTLTYFVAPAYKLISQAFASKVPYTKVNGSLWDLDNCYNVSGLTTVQFPTISITFVDGAVFTPHIENYMIQMNSDWLTYCLAILEAPREALTILGNYLQQNMHVLYDLEEHKLGFAPMDCSTSMDY